jgi:pimeloyl-ACP methyl ester carboxylesterase
MISAQPSDLLCLAEGPPGAPVVLALHSMGMNARSWDAMAKESLSTVYAFDQLGHGARATAWTEDFGSLVMDAQGMLDQLPAGSVHLVGHSMGGCVAASLAALRPDEVASLTLVATPLKGIPQFAERAIAVVQGGMAPAISQTLPRWFGPRGQAEFPDAWRQANAALHDMLPAGFDAAWRALSRFSGLGALPAITAPTMVCSFADDLSTPPSVGVAAVDILRGGGTRAFHCTLSGGGHMGILTRSTELTFLLRSHWTSDVASPVTEAKT